MAYSPQFLEREADWSKTGIRELWERIPTPEKAQRIRGSTLAKRLVKPQVRKISAEQVLKILRPTAVIVAEGAIEEAMGVIKTAFQPLAVIMEEKNSRLLPCR